MPQYLTEIVLYCFPGSIRFDTTERCGGVIRVNYRNKWENVCIREFPPQFREKLCQELGCQGYNANFRIPGSSYVVIFLLHLFSYWKPDICCISKCGKKCLELYLLFKSKDYLETTLNCSLDHNDIRHCVSHKPCGRAQLARIYCYGNIRKMFTRYQGLTNLND